MPALKGSLSYARFFVDGEVPEDFRERFMKPMRLRAMKPLLPEDEVTERSGWCVIGEPLETELRYENVFYNNFINLGFRTDRWAIPGPLLRAKVREAELAYREKKGRERLSKSERAELKEVVTRRLRKQLTPTMRALDFSWSLEEGVVRFFSLSTKPGLAMSDLFTKTFGLKLIPEAPYTLAARLGLDGAQEKAWDQLEATLLLRREEG